MPLCALCALFGCLSAFGQIDPVRRQLLQFGYNSIFQGHAPLAGYAFYYLNRPEFYRTNLTLRLAVAPVYFDAELGVARALGPYTDLAFGLSGGGFADRYNEVRGGNFFPRESFDGHGGGASLSVYHLFNPGARIPLHGVARGGGSFATYSDTDDTDEAFQLPDDRGSANFRVGLRYGGKEPVLFPSVALELSLWAESLNRGNSGGYGYQRDRDVNASAQLYYGHGSFAYTFERGDNMSLSLTAGDSAHADRLSAYRLGGVLPQIAEFPLIIPGYYHQELSARRFAHLNARYAITLDTAKRWQLAAMAATAVLDYVPGLKQADRWNSGVGGGIAYHSQSWKVALNYGYGLDAVRGADQGSHMVGLLVQCDLEHWLNKRHGTPLPGDVP